jgi:CubicO group peptidase (beta-lactamase class C family)
MSSILSQTQSAGSCDAGFQEFPAPPKRRAQLIHRKYQQRRHPLGMKDTGFVVPPDKHHRRSAAYGFDGAGQLTKRTTWGDVVVPERPQDMAYESGGQGLWSTIDDYMKFARLVIGDGAVDGERLLRPETVSMMTTNQLTYAQRAHFRLPG